MEVNDLRHRRDALCDRLREDYQLELAELYGQAESPGEHSSLLTPHSSLLTPEAAEEEIAELRAS